ncbi:MAG: response regulator [Methanobacteriota archaeon]
MSEPVLSVLYVNDEAMLLEITRSALKPLGFYVETAESGSAALDMLRNKRYEAIISDYQMPGMDGIALLKEIRCKDPYIPFILFIGPGVEEVVIEAIECGADIYLMKGGDIHLQINELPKK